MHPAVALLLLLAALPASGSEIATRVVLVKHTRTLSLYRGDHLLGSYRVALGFEPVGTKQQQGDGRTPEGRYLLDRKNPHSAFYKAIHVSYPDAADRARARRHGVDPGGDIMIHGQKNRLGWAASMTQRFDWTRGCIAVSDADMDRIWSMVPAGTPILITP
ncbi:L,D-transpeptidase family protein [Dyella ginsengisoli]|uniref:L,D-transpeptidase family protein n=1 Tax=Dyella ginsengisoli TaxID=363848 RepID=UPI0003456906|nr:L,D-transpeptidase family protein [Dyella ginsengisoli]